MYMANPYFKQSKIKVSKKHYHIQSREHLSSVVDSNVKRDVRNQQKPERKAKKSFLSAEMTEYMENGAASAQVEETYKEKLLRSLKKEVKHIMEESVMLKCVHEDSASVSSLCASVDACLSYGLKRRALGLFKTRFVLTSECISILSS